MTKWWLFIIGVVIGVIVAAAILWLLSRRKRKLPPLTLRIMLWIRSVIRHTARCVKQRALRPLYKKRLREAFVELAAEKQPIKLSDLESNFSEEVTVTPEEEETEKELLVLMN